MERIKREMQDYVKITEDLKSSLENKTNENVNLKHSEKECQKMHRIVMDNVIRHMEEHLSHLAEHVKIRETEILYLKNELHVSQERHEHSFNPFLTYNTQWASLTPRNKAILNTLAKRLQRH